MHVCSSKRGENSNSSQININLFGRSSLGNFGRQYSMEETKEAVNSPLELAVA